MLDYSLIVKLRKISMRLLDSVLSLVSQYSPFRVDTGQRYNGWILDLIDGASVKLPKPHIRKTLERAPLLVSMIGIHRNAKDTS